VRQSEADRNRTFEDMAVSEGDHFRTVEFRGEQVKLPVYLDHHATTPLDPRVLDAMLPYFTERFGNPHSAQHAYGWAAEEAIERARTEIAQLIGALPDGSVVSSGAGGAEIRAIRGGAARALWNSQAELQAAHTVTVVNCRLIQYGNAMVAMGRHQRTRRSVGPRRSTAVKMPPRASACTR
jgi:hypothetical protein